MSNKKSPNKEKSPAVDTTKSDEVKVDRVKDDVIAPVNEPSVNVTSAQSDSNDEAVVSLEKSATPVPSDDLASPIDVKISTEKVANAQSDNTRQADTSKLKRSFPFLGVLNLLLIIGLTVAAFYYWQMQQKSESEKLVLLL